MRRRRSILGTKARARSARSCAAPGCTSRTLSRRYPACSTGCSQARRRDPTNEENELHRAQGLLKWLLLAACVGWYQGMAYAAESYPSRPIRLVVPYPPGGNTDVFARLIAQRLTQAWGQQVVVDNRAGGNTLIGTELVARSVPDGYTLMLTTLTFTV